MPIPTLEADEVAQQLPADMRKTLALLQVADDELAELTFATYAFGSRAMLMGYGVIDPISPHDQPSEQPVVVKLTGFGREVINACESNLSEEEREELRKQQQAFDEARARRLEQGDGWLDCLG